MNKQVQVLCNADDKNIDTIASRTSILLQAAQENNLVAISCIDKVDGKDVILLAVMAKDEGDEFIQYSPIGQLFYPDDMSFEQLTPPEMAISAEEEETDVAH